MSATVASPNYILKKKSFLKKFHKIMKFARPLVATRYGEEIQQDFEKNAILEYEKLIPAIPNVGTSKIFIQFVTATAQYLVVYRILQRHGIAAEEVGQFLFDISKAFYTSLPRFLVKLLSKKMFSPRNHQRMRELALESQSRPYPMGYVFDFIEGDGQTFDFGIYYRECATCKFLKQQGVPELAKYVCPVDILSSKVFNWGLQRTTTLAEGYDRCDFRFKKGGPTQIQVPDGFNPA